MVLSTLLNFLYPPPPSLYVTAMSVIGAVSMANAGFMEIKGKHMQYSKFWKVGAQKSEEINKAKVSSKTGMLIFYTPAFLAGVASFALYPYESLRFSLLSAALSIHFFKRVLETLFVHNFSGAMNVEAAITVSLSYFLATSTMIYAQHLTQGLPDPSINLMYTGIPIFLIGIIGNFYHHYLLSKLRTKGDKGYKIPKGGLFSLVICPHYLFEIVDFIGLCCISQTVYAVSFTSGTIVYLIGRSYVTRNWYISKFEDFPKTVKALIPFIF